MSTGAPASPLMAKQGHRYLCNGKSVLALESGRLVKVLYFDPDKPWQSSTGFAQADKLIPEPMIYHGDQIPQ